MGREEKRTEKQLPDTASKVPDFMMPFCASAPVDAFPMTVSF